MILDIFSYSEYKKYLNDYIQAQPKRGHGMRLRLAEAAECQLGYISQILGGEAHFNLEQADRITRFLGYSEEEAHFFLLLVQKARAGTRELQKYFATQIAAAVKKRQVLKERFQVGQPLSSEDQSTYYSAWYYAAIHILLTIPQFRSKQELAKKLQLELAKVNQVLDFLQGTGMVVQEGDQFRVGEARIFLGNDSPLISKHHMNWRTYTMRALERETRQDLHYTSVVSLSEKDCEKIRASLVKEIENIRKTVKESAEENLYAFTLDWYQV